LKPQYTVLRSAGEVRRLMSNNEDILAILLRISEEFNATLDTTIAVERGGDAPLYGREGVLDSLGLVSFLAAVEEAIEDRFGVTVTIASEKAISLKHSPFRTVGVLTQYVAELVHEGP
jgi:D-alanine--poly(phosphoribitol) ligase subunit 2